MPQQFFATSMVLTPLLRGLVGLDVDAPAGKLKVAPHLPPEWDSVRVEHIRVGGESVSLRLVRKERTLTLEAWRDGEFGPALGHRLCTRVPVRRGLRSSSAEPTAPDTLPGAIVAHVHGPRERLRLLVTGKEGWKFANPWPRCASVIDRRHCACSERYERGKYIVQLEGLAGARYAIGVRGPAATRMGVEVPKDGHSALEPSPPDARGLPVSA
ncbi:MAG: hypothetical protein U0163_12005 [Gemmatimonadaceae bacterium]